MHLIFKSFFFLTLLSFTCLHAMGQKQRLERIDSLLPLLRVAKEDTNKVNLLCDMSYTYCIVSKVEGLSYGEKALLLADKTGWQQGIAKPLKN